MTKLDYSKAYKKHKIRDKAIDLFRTYSNIRTADTIIGLAGPNIKEYCCNLQFKGFNNIVIYENKKYILLNQLNVLTDLNIDYKFDNIDNSKIDNKLLYDLDYCCTIKSINLSRLKLIDNYILTMSLRGYSREQTLKVYSNIKQIKGFKHFIFQYRDTSPMLTIVKFKTKTR